MEPIVLLSAYGYTTAFKITTAKVCTLGHFIMNWERGRFPSCVWVTYLNDPDAKARKLTAALIRKEFPEYVDSDYYRSVHYH